MRLRLEAVFALPLLALDRLALVERVLFLAVRFVAAFGLALVERVLFLAVRFVAAFGLALVERVLFLAVRFVAAFGLALVERVLPALRRDAVFFFTAISFGSSWLHYRNRSCPGIPPGSACKGLPRCKRE